jgi:hypothetical protein
LNDNSKPDPLFVGLLAALIVVAFGVLAYVAKPLLG